jgi:hypothetical protein
MSHAAADTFPAMTLPPARAGPNCARTNEAGTAEAVVPVIPKWVKDGGSSWLRRSSFSP